MQVEGKQPGNRGRAPSPYVLRLVQSQDQERISGYRREERVETERLYDGARVLANLVNNSRKRGNGQLGIKRYFMFSSRSKTQLDAGCQCEHHPGALCWEPCPRCNILHYGRSAYAIATATDGSAAATKCTEGCRNGADVRFHTQSLLSEASSDLKTHIQRYSTTGIA